MATGNRRRRIEELERLVEYHDHQYWVLDAPVISDEEYDLLVRQLEELAPDSPVLQRIGGRHEERAATFRNKIRHDRPMLSLDKCYDEPRFLAWLKNTVGRALRGLVQEGAAPGGYDAFADLRTEEELPDLVAHLPVTVTPKIDGVAASLKYDAKGTLQVAATRGDGAVGEDFTVNARLIPTIPRHIESGPVEVRGEVYMKRSVFREKYGADFPNPRNLTAGSLKQKRGNRAQLFDLSFFAYDLLGDDAATERDKRARLERLGFEPVPAQDVTARDVPALYEEALLQRESWDFDADGLVIRLDDTRLHEPLGITAHHPRYAIAFKFQGDAGISTLQDVVWSVSRSGTITPVAIVEPVFLSGAQVTRSTLHNIKEFQKLALRRGDRVQLKRRGDVIPKVEKNLGGGTQPFEIPDRCPSCGAPTLYRAPQLFVAGYRFNRFGDKEQLKALIRHQKEVAATIGEPGPDTWNSTARRTGDPRFREALTWGRGGENRDEVLALLAALAGPSHAAPELPVLAVHDPTLESSQTMLALVNALVDEERLALYVLDLQVPGNTPAIEPVELATTLAEDFLTCSQPETCRDAVLGSLEHFIQTLGVDGFGRKIIESLYEHELVREPEDFFRLRVEELVGLERMGEILATKLVANVQAARSVRLSVFLRALGVDELARHVSTLLEREYGDLDHILGLSENHLMRHDSIAFGIAHAVVHGLRRKTRTIARLLEYVEPELPPPSPAAQAAAQGEAPPFAGQSFVFTGKMRTMPRKEAQEAVHQRGGETPDGVRTDLTWLVVGDEGSPLFGEGSKGSKMRKAEKYNSQGAAIRIISETDFLAMLASD